MNASTDIEREHEHMFELLPLAVGGGLPDADRAALDMHLAACDACRAELALLRSAQAQLAASDMDLSPDAAASSLERVLSRVQGERIRGSSVSWGQRLLRAWAQWPAGARWLVAGQAAVMAALAVLVLPLWLAQPPTVQPGFETATGPATAGTTAARVRVAWRDDANAAAVRDLLTALNASVVAGPSAAGFYTLQLGPGTPPDALAKLRARTDLVQWAETQ
jgi:anti-sigma factor RsiW